MQMKRLIPACALLALACCAASAQTKHAGSFTFNYDASHDQINTSAISFKPLVTPPPAAPTPTTGTIVVTINISIVSHHVKAHHINCSLLLIGGDIDEVNSTVDGGIETANKHAESNGPGSAVCTLTIPYSWSLTTTDPNSTGVLIVFGAADHSDDDGIVLRSTLQFDGPRGLPPNGTTRQFAYDVTL